MFVAQAVGLAKAAWKTNTFNSVSQSAGNRNEDDSFVL